MARKRRSPEEIEEIKQNIVAEAMKLIIEVGFQRMSLRKLAERVGMSATNIYYYYANKDEIYLNIQIKGFKALQHALEGVNVSEKDPYESLKKMIQVYLDFGFSNPDTYQIMLNSDTPRYLEYKNMAVEPVAFQAKQSALEAIAVPLHAIEQISEINTGVLKCDNGFRAYQLWITLHGIVTLNNRNILLELDENPEKLIDRLCEELMVPFYATRTASTGEGNRNEN